jgi:hypothetical protein
VDEVFGAAHERGLAAVAAMHNEMICSLLL